MSDRSFDVLELGPPLSGMVNECELTGRRSIFVRNGIAVAVLISNDEYVALRETVEMSADPATAASLAASDEEVQNGAVVLPEDLFVE
jgi:PHD/YefM family antitoxin component YafN of YafNO toxin-antitoxin module